jgi:hypothetical protein
MCFVLIAMLGQPLSAAAIRSGPGLAALGGGAGDPAAGNAERPASAPSARVAPRMPILDYEPTALSHSFVFGSGPLTVTQGMTLTNTSTSPLTYTINEISGDFEPLRAVPPVLLVQQGSAPSATRDAALQALSAAGYAPTLVINTVFEGKTVAELLTYAAVMYIGNPGSSNTGASNVKMIEYLDAGGRLLIADNDLGFSNRSTPSVFYSTYLQAIYSADNAVSKNNLRGEGIMFGINTSVEGDAYPDSFTLGPSATRIFQYGTTNLAGGSAISRNGYSAIYLAFDYHQLGTIAVGEGVETTVMERAMAWLIGGDQADNIPWLTESPAKATIAGQSSSNVAIGWHPNKVEQPGTYTGTLTLSYSSVATQTATIPVTMVVTPAPSQARISGTVSSTGVCDAQNLLLAGAQVSISGSGGFTTTITTDASGGYSYFVPAAGTYTLSAAAASHAGQTQNVSVTAGGTAVQNFVLRLQKPCVAVTPGQLSVTLAQGAQATRPFTIASSGALPLHYRVLETSGREGVIGAFNTSPADSFGYSYGSSQASWIDATTGTPLTVSDDGEVNFTLPFSFHYYGITTSQVRVANNGAILLNTTTGDVSNTNADLSGAAPNNMIAPFWDDIDDEQGGVFWKASGVAPNRMVAIQWNNRPHFPGNANPNTATFQLVLYENGNIGFQYQDVNFGDSSVNNGASATIGIRGPSAAERLQYSFNTPSVQGGQGVCFIYPGNQTCGAEDIPWLSTSPISGTLAGTPPSQQQVAATFDAASLEPGTYQALIAVTHDSPQPAQFITATLNVSNPPGYGTLSGTVVGLGPCDAPGAALAGAAVLISGTSAVTTTTNSSGLYSAARPIGAYTVTISATGYISQTAAVTLTDQQTTIHNVSLRRALPCQQLSAAALASAQAPNQIVSRTLTISNTGATPLSWTISERAGGAQAPLSQAALSATKPGHAANPATRTEPSAQAPQANLILDGGLETTSGGTGSTGGTNPKWQSSSTNFSTVLFVSPDGVPAHGGIYVAWFGGIGGSNPTEVGTLQQSVTIPNGVATMSFWLLIGSVADRPGDILEVKIDNTVLRTLSNLERADYDEWTRVTIPISQFADGGAHTVGFRSVVEAGGNTNFFVDDIALDSTACSANAIPWLTATPSSGAVAPGGSANITVAFNSAGLASGTYTGTLCLNTNDPIQPGSLLPVTLTVSGGSPSAIFGADTVASTQAGGQVVNRSLAITNTGSLAVSWAIQESDGAAAGCSGANELPWLTATPASGSLAGSASASVQLAFNSAGLAPGTYTGTLCLINSTNQALLDSVAVSLQVQAGGAAFKVYMPRIAK